MPAVHRHTDVCTGHGCFPSRANAEGSPDVFVNGLGWHCVGHGWQAHCCGPVCHGGALAAGSASVFVNGRAAGRVGDPVSCGSMAATGSVDVFCG